MFKTILISSVFAVSFGACTQSSASSASSRAGQTETQIAQNTQTDDQSISFPASDDGNVIADLFVSPDGKQAPLIMLFHQAGANGRGEYKSITPKLLAKGYSVLQVDQRSGGGRFGNKNRTVKARGKSTKYCQAYPDMEGAISYVKDQGFSGPLFAWGSSYSAALTVKLAGDHGDDLTAALAFSPASGGGMGECAANIFVPTVDIPFLALRPRSEMNSKNETQKKLFEEQGLGYFISEKGVHGSSMLDPTRAKGDPNATWNAVWAFLEAHN
jgi:dienelactone hydrolase